MTDLLRALATVAEPPTSASARIGEILELAPPPTAAAYTEFFVLQQLPYASVYLGVEGMLGGEARDRIAGFWRALGCVAPRDVDHLSTMLGAYAAMCDRHEAASDSDRREQWLKIRHAFLWEHLLSWLPAYLHKARAAAPAPFGRWAELLLDTLIGDARRLPDAAALPAHLRDVPDLGDPCEDEDDFVAAILAPVRSGMILTHADLLEAGRALDAGVGVRGRHAALRMLLHQEPAATLNWLENEAAVWERRHTERSSDLGAVAAFWHHRASSTRRVLRARRHDLSGGADEGDER